jgi:hypothetical protein
MNANPILHLGNRNEGKFPVVLLRHPRQGFSAKTSFHLVSALQGVSQTADE